MLKIMGCLFTVGAATLLGAGAAMELEASYQEMQYLSRLVGMLAGEIRYSRSVLSHIFRKLSRDAKAPYDAWMRQMSARLEARKGGSLGDIWRESAAVYLEGTKLPKKEKERFFELGMCLGDMDSGMQIEHLKKYQEQLELSIGDIRPEIQNRKKLRCCLGVVGGISIAILLG